MYKARLGLYVGIISRFMEIPRVYHFIVAKRIMMYVKGTTNHGLLLSSKAICEGIVMIGYSDSN